MHPAAPAPHDRHPCERSDRYVRLRTAGRSPTQVHHAALEELSPSRPEGHRKSTWLEQASPRALTIDLLDSGRFLALSRDPASLAALVAPPAARRLGRHRRDPADSCATRRSAPPLRTASWHPLRPLRVEPAKAAPCRCEPAGWAGSPNPDAALRLAGIPESLEHRPGLWVGHIAARRQRSGAPCRHAGYVRETYLKEEITADRVRSSAASIASRFSPRSCVNPRRSDAEITPMQRFASSTTGSIDPSIPP